MVTSDSITVRIMDAVSDYMDWPRNLILFGKVIYMNGNREPDPFDEFHWVSDDDDDKHFLWREVSTHGVQWCALSPLELLAETAELVEQSPGPCV